jgi:hypothetical protein
MARDKFLEAGLHLTRLVDVDLPSIAAKRAAGELVPEGEQLPYFCRPRLPQAVAPAHAAAGSGPRVIQPPGNLTLGD